MIKSMFALPTAFWTVFLGLLIQTTSLIAQDQFLPKSKARSLVFVITGESNSGGIGKNSDASAVEREPRPSVQIMNLSDGNFKFEALQLGVNNLRDHHRLEKFYDDHHGFELGLANAVEADFFPGRKPVYLIKTGHGGSRIVQWTESSESGFWKKFVQRIDAAKRQLSTVSTPQWVVWFSLGINDAIDGAPSEPWKKGVRDHIKRMKEQMPGVVIVMTQFQAMGYPKTNQAIAEIANEDTSVVAVDSSNTTLRDRNHWDYAGLKTMASRMAEATKELLEATGELNESAEARIQE